MSDQRIIFKSVPYDGFSESFLITIFEGDRQTHEIVAYKQPETAWEEVEAESRRQFAEYANRSKNPPSPKTIYLSKGLVLIRTIKFGH